MRQGQQNRRGRGRSRKPQNPLARNFESNGPDVKIRGTASHIAEKYMSLARDALASGDSVTAESYLQHAEHYNRIIMAAHSQAAAAAPQVGDQSQGQQAGGGRGKQEADGGAEGESDEATSNASGENAAPSEGRGRGRGRQRRNGGQAASAQPAPDAEPSTDAESAPSANGGAEANGSADGNGAEQPVEVAATEEAEGATSTVN